jgi:hypothetical protein
LVVIEIVEQQLSDTRGTLRGDFLNRRVVAKARPGTVNVGGETGGGISRQGIVVPVDNAALCPVGVAIGRDVASKEHRYREIVQLGGD